VKLNEYIIDVRYQLIDLRNGDTAMGLRNTKKTK